VTEATTEENLWYLARDGRQHGPLSHLEMTKLVELGHLRATDLVWRPGFADWRPAPSVFELTPAPSVPPTSQVQRAPEPAKTEPQRAEATAAAQAAPAARPQPSFANMSSASAPSAAQSTTSAAPMRFEFPAAEAAPTVATPRNDQPSFHTETFETDTQTSRFGAPPSAQSEAGLATEPFRMEPLHSEDLPPRRKNSVAVALGVLAVVGGLATAGYVYQDVIKATLERQTAQAPEIPVVESPGNAGAPAESPGAGPSVAAAQPEPVTPAPTAAGSVTETTNAIDAALQASPFWSYAKAEFPQWYADRVREIGEMKQANEPDAAIDRKLAEQIVALRRQNASNALASSPARLTEIAEAFVVNLSAMQSQSVDACYEFIEKGELTPTAVALVQKPAEGAALHAQLRAVLAAVVDGQKTPVTRTQPLPADYNLLAAELGTIGWSQADIQLFADPKALAAAPRDRVCKMVKDWFTAHLAVKDDPARERLLYETLRLVIAG
jgi:hypothetical protein